MVLVDGCVSVLLIERSGLASHAVMLALGVHREELTLDMHLPTVHRGFLRRDSSWKNCMQSYRSISLRTLMCTSFADTTMVQYGFVSSFKTVSRSACTIHCCVAARASSQLVDFLSWLTAVVLFSAHTKELTICFRAIAGFAIDDSIKHDLSHSHTPYESHLYVERESCAS